MRNFHKAEGVVFLSVCFLSVFIRSQHFGKRQCCTDVQDVHLNVGGWGGVWLEGRGLCILSHSAFKNCTEETVWEGRNSRDWLGEKKPVFLMPGSRPVPKSHEDVHEHARSTLNPKGGRINTNQRKKLLELSHTAELSSLWKFEPHSVYRQFQVAVGSVSRRANC